jgi:Xaa-Pro aminopeptidase
MMHDSKPKVPYDSTTRKEYLELPFPLTEYEQRVNNTRRLMVEQDLGGLIAFGDQNDLGYLAYLANFEPMMGRGAVVVTSDSISLVTDSAFHGEPMHSLVWRTWIDKVRIAGWSVQSFVSEVNSALSGVKGKVGAVGLYSCPTGKLGFDVVDVERFFLEMKSRKTDNELKVMREASRITSCGMRAAVEAARIGVRETEVVAEACKVMYEEGASRLAFQPIVTAGPRAGTKHDYPSKRKIEEGDMVYIDLGAIWNGYLSDMSRTKLIGNGNQIQRSALDSILEIYNDLRDRIWPGVRAGEVAQLGEKLAESKGWRRDFWATGHGLGTGFSEIPMFSPTSRDNFEPGMVFAYEPMIVRLGLGTAVVEDTLAVTDTGVTSLTEYERKLW